MRLSPYEIQTLHTSLSVLNFDPLMDSDPSQEPVAGKYLRLYGMDYSETDSATHYLHRWGRVTVPPYTIACHYWLPQQAPTLPEKGMVMVVHGYFDHVGLYGHLVRHLLEQGYGVVAFDLPGHGLSSGERASIASFDDYVDVFEAILSLVKRAFPVSLCAVGQSTGGAILLKHLSLGNRDLARVALLAPLVEPAQWWFNRIIYALGHRVLKGVKRVFKVNSGDADFVRFIEHDDPLQPDYIPIAWLGAMRGWVRECRAMKPCDFPATIIQGTADTTLSWRTNLRILRRKFPAATVVLIPEARHHLVNESPPLRQQVFELMGF
ncbi:MAG: alpha/beta hydrolase [Porticoccaceae bacterium]